MSQAHIANYRRDIDGLRAISVLIVLVFHAFPEWLPGGFIGVDVFFVISGFLITGIIVNDIEANRFTILSFYNRRIRRIFPALIVTLTSALIGGWILLSNEEYQQLAWHVLASGFFFQNITLFSEAGYFDVVADYKPLLHLWSLSVEEQFYVAYPLLLLLLARSRALLFWIGLLALISFAACMFQTYIVGEAANAFFLPQYRFWELLAGALVQIKMRSTGKIASPYLSLIGVLLLSIGVCCTSRFIPFPSLITLLPVVGAMCVLAGDSKSAFSARILGSSILVALGLISYPLYLFHWPLFSFARIVTAQEPSASLKLGLIALSVALATVTYLLIERPLRFAKTRSKSKWGDWRVGIILIGMALAIGGGYYVYRSNGVASRAIGSNLDRHMRDRITVGIEIEKRYKHRSCDREPLLDRAALSGCLMYGPDDASETIVVWGDSHAEAWSSVFFDIADRFGKRVIIFRQLGCAPILDAVRTDGGAFSQNCKNSDYSKAVVATVQNLKPKRVFLVARWSLYSNGWYVGGQLQPATHFLSTNSGRPATLETSRETIRSNLPKTLYALAEAAPVTVVKTIPILKAGVEAIFLKRMAPTTAAEHRLTEGFVNDIFEHAMLSAPSSLKAISTWDPAELLCREDQCAIAINKTVMYRDDNHITPQGSLLFENEILGTLR